MGIAGLPKEKDFHGARGVFILNTGSFFMVFSLHSKGGDLDANFKKMSTLSRFQKPQHWIEHRVL